MMLCCIVITSNNLCNVWWNHNRNQIIANFAKKQKKYEEKEITHLKWLLLLRHIHFAFWINTLQTKRQFDFVCHTFICFFVCLFVNLILCDILLFVSLSVCLFVNLFPCVILLFVSLSVCLSIWFRVSFLCLFLCLFVCLLIWFRVSHFCLLFCIKWRLVSLWQW